MNIPSIIFFLIFCILTFLLLIFGIISFIFNYKKFQYLKVKVANNKLHASGRLKEKINSTFWIYYIAGNEFTNEIADLIKKNDQLLNLHKKYKFYLNLQLISLLLLFITFAIYVIVMIAVN